MIRLCPVEINSLKMTVTLVNTRSVNERERKKAIHTTVSVCVNGMSGDEDNHNSSLLLLFHYFLQCFLFNSSNVFSPFSQLSKPNDFLPLFIFTGQPQIFH